MEGATPSVQADSPHGPQTEKRQPSPSRSPKLRVCCEGVHVPSCLRLFHL